MFVGMTDCTLAYLFMRHLFCTPLFCTSPFFLGTRDSKKKKKNKTLLVLKDLQRLAVERDRWAVP